MAVVDFDHGVGYDDYTDAPGEFHYMFEDNYGLNNTNNASRTDSYDNHMVYDMDIYKETDGNTFFAFINTCLSADTTYGNGNGTYGAVGMPYAWTHRRVGIEMSNDGYNSPDSGAFCYIGFPYGSAALDQTITGIAPKYATWVENFFSYALGLDISVNHALDEASLDNFGDLFGDTDLADGFGAVWPMWNTTTQEWEDPPYYGSTLVVYGNGNMHLYEYFVHDYVSATHYGSDSGVIYPDNMEGGSNDGQYAALYALSWGSQAMIVGSIGWEAKGHIYLYGMAYLGYTSYIQVWVSPEGTNYYSVQNLTITQSSPYCIDIGSWSSNFQYIAIVVYPYGFFAVDSVLVIPEPAQAENYYVYDTEKWENGGYVDNHEYMRGSYYDDYEAVIVCPDEDDSAFVLGTMNKDASGHVEIYGRSEYGYSSELYVYRSNDYNNWYQIGNMQLITSTQAQWIDIGTYAGSFKYLAVACWYGVYYEPAYFYVDCVRVTDT